MVSEKSSRPLKRAYSSIQHEIVSTSGVPHLLNLSRLELTDDGQRPGDTVGVERNCGASQVEAAVRRVDCVDFVQLNQARQDLSPLGRPVSLQLLGDLLEQRAVDRRGKHLQGKGKLSHRAALPAKK